MYEKLYLQWDDFQDNVRSAYGNLRETNDFADVTLACEDGHQIEAHKVILAVSSPLFENLLKRNKHNHPLIYMRGMKSEDLNAIVDFLYYGEANVFQENLDSFLGIAEELKLKGLTGQNSGEEKENGELNPIQMKPIKALKKDPPSNLYTNQMPPFKRDESSNNAISNERVVAIPNYVAGDLKELDEKVKSMMEIGRNKLTDGRTTKICKLCGKEGAGIAIRDHIEANHLEGVSLPCNVCGKTFRSRKILRLHKCDASENFEHLL